MKDKISTFAKARPSGEGSPKPSRGMSSDYPLGHRAPRTHLEISNEQPISCAAWHMTFGGRCLNCGGTYDAGGVESE